MDIAVREKFRPGTHRSDYDQIAALGVDLLAATDWAVDDLARPGHLALAGVVTRLQGAAAGAGGGNHRHIELASQGHIVLAIGAHRQCPQAMLPANANEFLQVDGNGCFRQLVQRQNERRIVEELRCLGDLVGQLALEPAEVVTGQLQQGDGQHAALELEYRVLFLAHHLPISINEGTYSGK